MGNFYAVGRGVTLDLVQAHAWFTLAYARGELDVKSYIPKFEGKMTPAQIAEAAKLARELDEKIKKK